MNITDIAKVKVSYLYGPTARYANDPELEIVLKRGRAILRLEDFRFWCSDDFFFAERDGEVMYYAHDRRNHRGFGGSKFSLRMKNGWSGEGWRGNCKTSCWYEASTNTVHISGPWSSNAKYASKYLAQPCVTCSVLNGDSRESIRNPRWYQKQRKRGVCYEGTPFACNITLELARAIVDRFIPHCEMTEGNYGWTVKFRGMSPKNPCRPYNNSSRELSGEQMGAVFFR